jgi:hypothetical protein
MSSLELKAKYFALMQRAVDVLALLPDPETIDTSDEAVMADATMLLAEFNKIDDEMNEIVMVMKCFN